MSPPTEPTVAYITLYSVLFFLSLKVPQEKLALYKGFPLIRSASQPQILKDRSAQVDIHKTAIGSEAEPCSKQNKLWLRHLLAPKRRQLHVPSSFFGFLQCRLSTASLYETLCGLLYQGYIFFLIKKLTYKYKMLSEKEFLF